MKLKNAPRTAVPGSLEYRLRAALPDGLSLVRFTLGDRERIALVDIIGSRTYYMPKPAPEDMYSSWSRARGDTTNTGENCIKVWAARDVEFMRQFEGEPVASFEVPARTP